MQKTTIAYETIEGKISFERMCKQYGFQIEAYHADNGIFRENKWTSEYVRQGQRLKFVGVNAHHTNGIIEKISRSLLELPRVIMIHEKKRRQSAISANLWTYYINMAT